MKLLTSPFKKRRRAGGATSASLPTTVLPDANALAAKFPDAAPWQVEIIASVMPFTMTSPERIFALVEAVAYVCENNIAGDFVECGVWKGGSSAAIAKTLVHLGQTQRTLWMYDTFDGMSAPTDSDVDFLGQTADTLLDQQDVADAASVWCRSPLEEVKETMSQTGYPMEYIQFIQGKVEETLPQQAPKCVSLLRLDTDWYESTRCELEILFPCLQAGGVLIIDDYGHWQGCRKAVDEYFQQQKIAMMLNRIDYTGRIGIFCPREKNND